MWNSSEIERRDKNIEKRMKKHRFSEQMYHYVTDIFFRMYCIQSGLRQEDLAREVDVSRRTIITAESDNCNLSLATTLRLVTCFQRTVDELFVKEQI